jgi:hypothetical protein
MEARPELLGMIELREPRGGRPAGAIGAVVERLPTEAIIEIVDEQGRTAELMTVPSEAVRVSRSEPPDAEAAR